MISILRSQKTRLSEEQDIELDQKSTVTEVSKHDKTDRKDSNVQKGEDYCKYNLINFIFSKALCEY